MLHAFQTYFAPKPKNPVGTIGLLMGLYSPRAIYKNSV
jgi:hypothetical protein